MTGILIFSFSIVFALVVVGFTRVVDRRERRKPDYHRIALLESETRVHIGHVVLMAEEKAEAERRRQIVDNAREDFVYGIGRYGQSQP